MKKIPRKNSNIAQNNNQSVRISLSMQRLLFRLSVLSAVGMWLMGVGVNIYPDAGYFYFAEYLSYGFAGAWVIVSIIMFIAVRKHKRELTKSLNFAQPVNEDGEQLSEDSEYIYEEPEKIKVRRAKKGFAALMIVLLVIYYSVIAVQACGYGIENIVVYLMLLYLLEVVVFATFVLEPGSKMNFKALIRLYYLFLIILLPSLVINVMDFSFLHVHYQKISNPKYISKAILTIVLGMIVEFILLMILFIGLYRKRKPDNENEESNPNDESYVNMDGENEDFEDEEG